MMLNFVDILRSWLILWNTQIWSAFCRRYQAWSSFLKFLPLNVAINNVAMTSVFSRKSKDLATFVTYVVWQKLGCVGTTFEPSCRLALNGNSSREHIAHNIYDHLNWTCVTVPSVCVSLSSPPYLDRLWDPPSLLCSGCLGTLLGVRISRRTSDQFSAARTAVKNAWNSIPIPIYVFTSCA